MLRQILTGQILPAMLMLEPEKGGAGGNPDMQREPGNGVLEAGNFSEANTSSPDEEPPDFGPLGEKHGEPPAAPKAPPAAPVEPKPGETAPPAAPAKVEPSKAPANPAAPKQGRNAADDEPFPDIEPLRPKPDPANSKPAPAVKADHPTDPNRYADGTFKPGKEPKPGEPTPPPAPVAPKPGEETTPKPGEKPPEPKALPKDDADIDGMEPKPNASDRTKNDFKALKDIAKQARAEARRIAAEAEELRTKAASTELPPDVKEKLAEYDELKGFKQMFELENEPKARAEYTAKLNTAEESFLTKLTKDPRIGLAEKGGMDEAGKPLPFKVGEVKSAEWLKAVGFDSPDGIKQINQWVRTIRDATGDELLAQEIVDMARGRGRIAAERQAEIEKLRGNRDAYLRERQQKEQGEFTEWGTEADKTLVKLSEGHDWTDFLKEPENATPEQKAFVEAHNKRVKEEIVPQFNAAVLDVFHRKPAETVNHVFNSMRLKYEVEPELSRVKTELEQAQARITELEGLANGVRQVASLSTADAAPNAPVTVAPSGISGSEETSADASIDAFLASRAKR